MMAATRSRASFLSRRLVFRQTATRYRVVSTVVLDAGLLPNRTTRASQQRTLVQTSGLGTFGGADVVACDGTDLDDGT